MVFAHYAFKYLSNFVIANFCIRKDAFLKLGGFTEDRDVGQEDHEFLAKAALDGRKMVVIPESMLYYRMHNRSDQVRQSYFLS